MSFDQFLKETSSILGLQWRSFRRRGVKRKVERRIDKVGLSRFEEYLSRIKEDPEERSHLSRILTVTISRFFRDREVFHSIENALFPAILGNGAGDLRMWSVGCASGEEPYSLSLLCEDRVKKIFPQIDFSILGTDIDDRMLERAKKGRYRKSSLKEVPEEVLGNYFKMENDFSVLDKAIRESVEFRRHDIMLEEPFLGMDIVLCRNLAFTYFSKERQIDVLRKIAKSLRGKGYLVVGKDESLPFTYPTLFVPVFPKEKIYQKF